VANQSRPSAKPVIRQSEFATKYHKYECETRDWPMQGNIIVGTGISPAEAFQSWRSVADRYTAATQ